MCALPSSQRPRQPGVPAGDLPRRPGRDPGKGRRARPGPRARPHAGPPARHPVGRPAATGRDGARHHPAALGVPHGRAAVRPRRRPAHRTADGDRRAGPLPRGHDPLRHPRPGRGADARRPDRDPAAGRAAGRRDATAAEPPPPPTTGERIRTSLGRLFGTADPAEPERPIPRSPHAGHHRRSDLVFRVPSGRGLSSGHTVHLAVDLDRVLVFAAGGRRIGPVQR